MTSTVQNLEIAHRSVAGVAGKLSLAIERKNFSNASARKWAEALHKAADLLEGVSNGSSN